MATKSKRAADPRVSAAAPAVKKAEAATVQRRATTLEKEREKSMVLVSVTVPQPFMFTHWDQTIVNYPVGIYEMPRAHAEDSFAMAMGVTINE